jgi:hypothetical protein
MTGDRRLATGERRLASALATVATRALPAILSLALPLAVSGPAAATAVAGTMWLTGSRPRSALPLASEARGLTRRRSLRVRRPATTATGGTMSVAVALEAAAAAAASARLTNGEVWILPILRLALWARQRRANEATVHRPILVGRGSRNRFLIDGIAGVNGFDDVERGGFRRSKFRGDGSLDELLG